MLLSIIVPVYNEENTIQGVIEKLLSLNIEKEIIVVNDGSRDRTMMKIDEIRIKNPSIKCIDLFQNRGKGNAISEAIKIASGDIIAVQDADLEYNPKDIINLVNILKNGNAQVVYGIRFDSRSRSPIWHKLGNKFLSCFASLLYLRWIKDMETCYKVMYRKNWQSLSLKSRRFEVEAEITAKIFRKKFLLLQVPISYNYRNFREGKKISWKDGLHTILVLFWYRFFY